MVAQWGWPAPELGSPLDPHQPSPAHASPVPAAWHQPEATQRLAAALQRAMLPQLLHADSSEPGPNPVLAFTLCKARLYGSTTSSQHTLC